MDQKKKINWTVTLFIVVVPLIGLVGTVLLLCYSAIPKLTWLLFFIMWALTGLSITAGYHRLFSHRTYDASSAVKLFFICFGAAAFEGRVTQWCCDHRYHHRYTDTDKDPYDIQKGFWHAHIGWLFTLDDSQRDYSNVKDLKDDPLVRWSDRYHVVIAMFFGFIFPTLVACCWGDPWGGLIVAGALRIGWGYHCTWAINSVCHSWGKVTYNDQSAKDNGLTAFLTWGEGFHNYHHQFPLDYRNGIRWFHYDPTKWLIAGLYYCGLASNLKRISRSRIVKYELKYQMQVLQRQLAERARGVIEGVEDIQQQLYSQLQARLKDITELEQKIEQLKNKSVIKAVNRVTRQRIRCYQQTLNEQWGQLQQVLKVWQTVLTVS